MSDESPDDLLSALHDADDDAAILARWSLLVGEALRDEDDPEVSGTFDLDAVWNRVDEFMRSHPAEPPDAMLPKQLPTTDDPS